MKGKKKTKKRERTTISFSNITLPSEKGNYMILLYSEKSNNFNEILEKYDQSINLPYLECPNCKSTNIIKWGLYKRNIYYIEEDIINNKIINIKRVKCKNCNKTHALIPYPIIPYRLNTIDLILNSLLSENTLDISFDTIYKWNKDFNKFVPYLKTMFSNICKVDIIKEIINNILYNFNQYFKINKKILMMMHNGIYDIQNLGFYSPT